MKAADSDFRGNSIRKVLATYLGNAARNENFVVEPKKSSSASSAAVRRVPTPGPGPWMRNVTFFGTTTFAVDGVGIPVSSTLSSSETCIGVPVPIMIGRESKEAEKR